MITPYVVLKVRSAFWKVMGWQRVGMDMNGGLRAPSGGNQGFMVIPKAD